MEQMAASQLNAWHERAPQIVACIGQPEFPKSLGDALSQLSSFDLDCVFAYPGEDRPLLLHDGLRGVSAESIMANYLNGTYLLDAVYSACRRNTSAGLYRLKDLAPDAFFEGEYFNSPDVHPCISMATGALTEEIVFLVSGTGGVYLAYSLMRQNASPPFSDDEMMRLQQVAPMVTALMSSHWRNIVHSVTHPSHQDGQQELVEIAFRTFVPSRLTAREQTIVSLVLRGHSSLSIANNLSIAEGTVKIHRKNIYTKLGISSQFELFNLFLKHILYKDV